MVRQTIRLTSGQMSRSIDREMVVEQTDTDKYDSIFKIQIFVAKLLPIMMNSIIKAFVYLLVTGVVVTIRWIHDPVSSNYKKNKKIKIL